MNTENKVKVLIAEDDEVNYLLIEEVMEKYNFHLIRAVTGTEAINICKDHKDIKLVFMDIKMPEMNGLEATKKIREFNTNVPIIAQTAYAMMSDRNNALAAGCTDYISKPIKISELEAMIRKYIDN